MVALISSQIKVIEAVEGARNIAKLNDIKKGEDILIITDSTTDVGVAEAITIACRERGADVIIASLAPSSPPATEPPKSLAMAMKGADVIFQLSSRYTYGYSVARVEANRAGARFQRVAASSIDLLTREGAVFPIEILFEIARKAEERLVHGKCIHITCKKGTDLKAEIDPKYVEGFPKRPAKRGEFSTGFHGGTGVLHMYPGWTANGIIFFDSVLGFKAPLEVPVRFAVENGRVTKVDGDVEQMSFYRSTFEKYGPNANHYGEIGIGLNPKARLSFSEPLEIERRAGVLHSGIGTSWGRAADGQPIVFAGIHVDNQLAEPNIAIDGEVFVEQGRLRLLSEPEILSLAKKYAVTF